MNEFPRNYIKMHHFLSFIFVLVFAISGSAVYAQSFEMVIPEEAGFSDVRLERLSELLNSYSEQQRISGGVALVLRDGKAVFFESFGKRDVEADADMPKDAIFRIASQTKAIVSVGVMVLQEEGHLLISDPVSKYLPEFTSTKVAVQNDENGYEIVDSKRQITIRDLLMHTAGIGYGWGVAADQWKEAGIQGWYFADRDEPIRETVRRIAALPMDAHPGEKFVYGYATDILGALIEEISGMKLDIFLSEKILFPLKMNDTHFYLPMEKIDRLATVYSATTDRGIVRAADPGGAVGQGHYVNGPRMSFSGGAGFLSTATDYGRFLLMLLNGGELDGVRILSPKSVELMTIDHLHDIEFRDGVGMGLGFDIVIDVGSRGTPGSLGDYGWGGAYHSTYWVSPKDRIVVVFFTQLLPATGSDIHGKLRTMIYQAMME
jgi:CubicO group peptidase (beta-lactamase class C family)